MPCFMARPNEDEGHSNKCSRLRRLSYAIFHGKPNEEKMLQDTWDL